jgi:hypothetical protein
VSAAVGSSGDGTSWATAWKDTTNITWASVTAGDIIEIDGGTTRSTISPYDFSGSPEPGVDCGMTYSPFTIGKSSVTIRRSRVAGRNGAVVISGGRLTLLPYVNQAVYSAANGAAAGVSDGGHNSITMDGMDRSGIIVRGCQIGFTLTGTGSTWRNIETFDNGIIANDTVGKGPTDTGGAVRMQGVHTWDRCLIHDDGADGFQNTAGATVSLAGSAWTNCWIGGTRPHPRYDYRPFCDIQDTGETTVLDAHADALQIWLPQASASGLTFDYCVIGPGKNQGVYPSDGGFAGQVFNSVSITSCLFIGINSHGFISGLACHGWVIDHCTIFQLMGGNEIPGNGTNTLTNCIKAGGYWLDTGTTWTASGNVWWTGDPVPGSVNANPGFASAPATGAWAPIATLYASDFTPNSTYASYGSPLHTVAALMARIDTLNG